MGDDGAVTASQSFRISQVARQSLQASAVVGLFKFRQAHRALPACLLPTVGSWDFLCCSSTGRTSHPGKSIEAIFCRTFRTRPMGSSLEVRSL